MAKKLKAKITRTKNNVIFDYRFRCPIDKRNSYFNEKDSVCFGACKRFMGEIPAVIPAKFDLKTMEVTEI